MVGLGEAIRNFRVLIRSAVIMDVEARRIAERLRARLQVAGCRLQG